MTGERFDNAFAALCDTPAEVRHLAMRSNLMDAIEVVVSSWNLSQAEATRRLGPTQPRLNDLLRGKISIFSLDALTGIATAAGLSVSLEIAAAETVAG
ncbi:helix-turn-helix domain-containing protein [Bosea sp. (in: a-proteobacteria)]|uniref:helix-turn-helix domain-containing protein n=1 Tax=Bosea sp. (in: a-proteobacteria) TaxID=1871050 RepID=UPI0027348388|nr:XRE family transcriptional regulator [Bosea sp. (in: a-proteobacteria)]MDP3410554.1 XRE family transcriptional regulator [Bosea sp. (in: a-proteobacteria)]